MGCTVEFDLSAPILADEDLVPSTDVEFLAVAIVILLAGAEGDDFSLLRLFLGGVRDDDAILGLFVLFEDFDEDTVS